MKDLVILLFGCVVEKNVFNAFIPICCLCWDFKFNCIYSWSSSLLDWCHMNIKYNSTNQVEVIETMIWK